MKETTKIFVDVNKNPIKFKGEALVEVKTEKSKETLPILITGNKNTQPLHYWDWICWTNWKSAYRAAKRRM